MAFSYWRVATILKPWTTEHLCYGSHYISFSSQVFICLYLSLPIIPVSRKEQFFYYLVQFYLLHLRVLFSTAILIMALFYRISSTHCVYTSALNISNTIQNDFHWIILTFCSQSAVLLLYLLSLGKLLFFFLLEKCSDLFKLFNVLMGHSCWMKPI